MEKIREIKRLSLWEEYRAEHLDGYSYSQFCYHLQLWRDTSDITMHIDHKVGDKKLTLSRLPKTLSITLVEFLVPLSPIV